MPEAAPAWAPTTRYLVCPEAVGQTDPSVSAHASLKEARSQVSYWGLYVPEPYLIVEAVTTYTVVEQHVPELQPARSC